jgi:hypothetical protein
MHTDAVLLITPVHSTARCDLCARVKNFISIRRRALLLALVVASFLSYQFVSHGTLTFHRSFMKKMALHGQDELNQADPGNIAKENVNYI